MQQMRPLIEKIYTTGASMSYLKSQLLIERHARKTLQSDLTLIHGRTLRYCCIRPDQKSKYLGQTTVSVIGETDILFRDGVTKDVTQRFDRVFRNNAEQAKILESMSK